MGSFALREGSGVAHDGDTHRWWVSKCTWNRLKSNFPRQYRRHYRFLALEHYQRIQSRHKQNDKFFFLCSTELLYSWSRESSQFFFFRRNGTYHESRHKASLINHFLIILWSSAKASRFGDHRMSSHGLCDVIYQHFFHWWKLLVDFFSHLVFMVVTFDDFSLFSREIADGMWAWAVLRMIHRELFAFYDFFGRN